MKRIAALVVAMLGCGGGDDHGGKGFAPLTGEPAPRDAHPAISLDAGAIDLGLVPDDGFDLAPVAPFRAALVECVRAKGIDREHVDVVMVDKGIFMLSPDRNLASDCIEQVLGDTELTQAGGFTIVAPAPACAGPLPGCLPPAQRGAIFVINVCATWAKPCAKLTDALQLVAPTFRADLVRYLQILEDVDAGGADAWAKQHAASFAVDGKDDPRAAALSADNLPTTYIYDASGTLRQTLVGAETEEDLRDAIARLLPPL